MQFIISLQQALAALVLILTSLIAIGTLAYKTYKQLMPNSGSSLRDAVDKLIVKVDKNGLATMAYLDNVVSDTAMFTTDKNGRCEWANKAYLNMIGKDMNDIIGNNWACSVHQDDRAAIETEWEHTATKSRNFDMTYRFVDSFGMAVKVHCQAWGNEKIGYFGIVKQIEDKSKK
jgi:PAS domain S-box-containing protein